MSVWKRFAASDTDGCAAQFIILILLVVLVALILSPDERETAAIASLATSGTLQPQRRRLLTWPLRRARPLLTVSRGSGWGGLST